MRKRLIETVDALYRTSRYFSRYTTSVRSPIVLTALGQCYATYHLRTRLHIVHRDGGEGLCSNQQPDTDALVSQYMMQGIAGWCRLDRILIRMPHQEELLERIRDLCAKIVSTPETQWEALLVELRNALHQHSELIRKEAFDNLRPN